MEIVLLVETACAGDKQDLYFQKPYVRCSAAHARRAACLRGVMEHKNPWNAQKWGHWIWSPEMSCGCPFMVHIDFCYFTYRIMKQEREKQQEWDKEASRKCYFKW